MPSYLHPDARIVFFGDSLTELGAQPGGYVARVADALRQRYPDRRIEVVGAGISGHKVPDLLARVDRDVLARQPTTTVVYIGINDVWHWATPGLTGTPRADFEAGLRALVDTLQQAGARVVLCTPSVIGEKPDGTNPQDAMLEAYAAVIRGIAAARETGLCDLRTAFLDHLRQHNPDGAAAGVLTTDGVHLNDAGNRLVAERMLAVLEG